MEKRIIKIGPAGTNDPENHLLVNWDDGGRGDLSHVFLSSNSDGIVSIQFMYIRDDHIFLTNQYGASTTGDMFHTIELKYPEEYLTRIEGAYSSELIKHHGTRRLPHVRFVKFTTNLAEYGPYGNANSYWTRFKFELGKSPHQFGGFHGTYDSVGLHSIGVYLVPKIPQPKIDPIISDERASEIALN